MARHPRSSLLVAEIVTGVVRAGERGDPDAARRSEPADRARGPALGRRRSRDPAHRRRSRRARRAHPARASAAHHAGTAPPSPAAGSCARAAEWNYADVAHASGTIVAHEPGLAVHPHPRMHAMLFTLAIVLFILWALGAFALQRRRRADSPAARARPDRGRVPTDHGTPPRRLATVVERSRARGGLRARPARCVRRLCAATRRCAHSAHDVRLCECSSSPTRTGTASGTIRRAASGSASSRSSTSCSTIRRRMAQSFLLDGQAIVLDDYLAVRPERARRARRRCCATGALEAGPWYVLADELIPSGEALVRNLLAGRDALARAPRRLASGALLPRCVRSSGGAAGRSPRVSACRVIVVWRGYGGARWPPGDTVRWRGADGAEAMLYHLAADGYEFGSSLPDATAAAARAVAPHARRARAARDDSASCCSRTAPTITRGSGGIARRSTALTAAAQPRRRSSRARCAASRGARRTRPRAARALPVLGGELRDSYGYTWTLQGTLATPRVAEAPERARSSGCSCATSSHGSRSRRTRGDARLARAAATRPGVRCSTASRTTRCAAAPSTTSRARWTRASTTSPRRRADCSRRRAARRCSGTTVERARRAPARLEAVAGACAIAPPRARGGVAELELSADARRRRRRSRLGDARQGRESPRRRRGASPACRSSCSRAASASTLTESPRALSRTTTAWSRRARRLDGSTDARLRAWRSSATAHGAIAPSAASRRRCASRERAWRTACCAST